MKNLLSLFLYYILANNILSFADGQNTLGKTECPCIDATEALSVLSNCVREDYETSPGILINRGVNEINCVPLSYGSFCQSHDLINDPSCFSGDSQNSTNVDLFKKQTDLIPEYCSKQWCYVDEKKCKESSELLYQSDSTVPSNLFHSYTTCGSGADSWLDFHTTKSVRNKVIQVTIPAIRFPMHYKTKDGKVDESLYSDDSVPFEGWIIDYLNTISDISNITKFTFTHRSGGSDKAIPGSIFTAAVYDVQVGISDMAAGMFWVTPERSRMTAFTTPLTLDRVYLWAKSVAPKESPNSVVRYILKAKGVMDPFDTNLWILLLLTLFLASIVSVWLANDDGIFGLWKRRFKSKKWINGSLDDKFVIMMKTLLDSFLAHEIMFFTGGIDINLEGSLEERIFMAGFAFFVLITISAYTANLTAFLTKSHSNFSFTSVTDATSICAHPDLMEDLKRRHPYRAMAETFKNGDCDAVAASELDILNNKEREQLFCDADLVVTDISVTEIPIAFPIDKDLTAGMSHWLAEGEKLQTMYKKESVHISFEKYQKLNEPKTPCKLELAEQSNDKLSLTPEQMSWVFIYLGLGLIIAVIIHFYSRRKKAIKTATAMQRDTTTYIDIDKDLSIVKDELESSDMIVKKEPAIRKNSKRLDLIEALKALQARQHDLLQTICSENDDNKSK